MLLVLASCRQTVDNKGYPRTILWEDKYVTSSKPEHPNDLEWETNTDGMLYATTVIAGQVFIVTRDKSDNYYLAGPLQQNNFTCLKEREKKQRSK
jgi:hypothetical protein